MRDRRSFPVIALVAEGGDWIWSTLKSTGAFGRLLDGTASPTVNWTGSPTTCAIGTSFVIIWVSVSRAA
jgi:hypothetical protein